MILSISRNKRSSYTRGRSVSGKYGFSTAHEEAVWSKCAPRKSF